MDVDALNDLIAECFSHRRWILLSDTVAGATASVEKLREWGGEEFLVVGSSEGVGVLPDADIVVVPDGPVPLMESFRRFARMVADPPAEVGAAVARFDPDGSARALAPLFAAPNEFLGRRLYGTRPVAWEAMEDKTVVDEIWDASGVTREPSEVVAVGDAPSAAGRLGGSNGTVWAADNTDGWHGGGEYTRWVPDADAAAAVVEWFRPRAAMVRVMPFLDGIPCSIHGVVTSDGVATLRPVELLTLRRTDQTGFVYAGIANVWDPPDSLAVEMRAAARRVGEELRRRCGYRGPFGIDGVGTAAGFRPTELNPRFSVGFAIQAAAVEGLPVRSFVRALVEGDLDVAAADLESTIRGAVEGSRRCHVGLAFDTERQPDTLDVDPSDGGGTLTLEASPTGSFVRWTVDMDHIPIGPSLAPKVVSVAAIVRDHWDLPVPFLTPV